LIDLIHKVYMKRCAEAPAMSALLVLLLVILAAAAALLALAYVVSGKLLRPPRRRDEWTPRDLGYEYEEVVVETHDGCKLRGWSIPRGTDRTVVVIHGYTSSRWGDYVRRAAEMLARRGFNVALFDMRAHGESEGKFTTLGYLEAGDVRRILDWLEKRGAGAKLGLIGFSMGGAITIMVAALDSRVKAAVADSPYIDVVSSGRNWVRQARAPLRHLLLAAYPLVVRLAARRAGVRLEDLVMYKYAERIKQPFLVVAAEKDALVPLEEVKRFYSILSRASPGAELWVVPVGHVRAVLEVPEEYERKVAGFFERWLA